MPRDKLHFLVLMNPKWIPWLTSENKTKRLSVGLTKRPSGINHLIGGLFIAEDKFVVSLELIVLIVFI